MTCSLYQQILLFKRTLQSRAKMSQPTLHLLLVLYVEGHKGWLN